MFCSCSLINTFVCLIIYRESKSHYSCRSQTQSIADKTEYIEQISGLLGSKDFRERIKGIDQLTADCQHNPHMVINSIFPVSPGSLAHSLLSQLLLIRVLLVMRLGLLSGVWCLQGQAARVQQQSQPVRSGISTENCPFIKRQSVPSGQHLGPGNRGQSPQF